MLKEFANDLKLQREKQKFSLPEISAQTRISEAYLRNLENGDFSFQQEIYIKAFIKEYANAIGLDSKEILKDYELAKKGDYTPKFQAEEKHEKVEPVLEETDKEKSKEEPVEEEPVKPVNDVKKEEPVKKIVKDKKEDTEDDSQHEKTDKKKRVRITPDKPTEHKVKTQAEKPVTKKEDLPPSEKKSLRKIDNGDKVQPSVLKGIGMFFLAVFIIGGLYFMAKAVFFDESEGDGPEIIRQKFDDVVKENERKLLGKRTDEEIRDSILKAEEEQRRLIEQNLDTMQLTINSIRSGSVIVVTDSTNMENPEKISFTGNQYGNWKATRSFLLTSPNTTAFTIELNGKKIDIKEKSVKNYLITRKDLQDSVKTGDQNQQQ